MSLRVDCVVVYVVRLMYWAWFGLVLLYLIRIVLTRLRRYALPIMVGISIIPTYDVR